MRAAQPSRRLVTSPRPPAGGGLPHARIAERWRTTRSGRDAVAGQAQAYSQLRLLTRPVLVNGVAGIVSTRDGQLFSVEAVTVRAGRIVAMDILADPARLGRLALPAI